MPREAAPDTRNYDSVENIVLEGDEVTHGGETLTDAPSEDPSDTSVDEPVDELDALTRRLSAATGEADAADERQAQERRAEAWQVDAAPAFNARHPDIVEFELSDAGTSGFGAAAAALDEGEADEGDEAAIDLDVPGLETAQHRWPWILGCAMLALLLALQSLNHWRDALAASPTWGAPLSRGYAALGVPLRPHWNLGAFDVRQEGAEADATAQQVIHVRLSLANRAPRAQPTPLLRLTLLDRYGKRIAQRDLTPADYWPKGRAPERIMASDERIDSEVAVRDPSAASASFELDVCLRDAGGAERCAGDTAPTANAGIP
ncbi:MAG TPA: DUF3426 domain-containing protein [Steroidobacteraceae bacterium]|nr:DUF3426 domain-containing protein [Steroidobacteraceae bacterium]